MDNYLILKESGLRAKAGVAILDNEVKDAAKHSGHTGGGAKGAPYHLHLRKPAPEAYNYDQDGGGYPLSYFKN
jgi:hypothetical protein